MVRKILLLLMLLALLGAAAAAWVTWDRIHTPHPGITEPVLVEIPPGTSVQGILGRLEEARVIADDRLARIHLLLEGSPILQAGTYRFDEPVTVPQALTKLIEGDVVQVGATIPEGLTLEETAESLARQGLGELDAFLAEMRDAARIQDLDPEAETLEGYLFPESYRFPIGTEESAVVDRLVDTFRTRWEERIAPRRVGDEGGRTVRELVTLASIVEKEARLPEERPVIAGVYDNRLRRGIALYADPTVIYALKQRETWDGDIRKKDLALESPYNTYRNPGLPPGPICSPGLSSLEAAVEPAEVDYLYFVSRNDGSHVFSATYREHRENVQKWQRDYWRLRRQEADIRNDREIAGDSSPG